MKRFHVHLSVPDLAASIHFYSGLFGAAPAVRKDDYAKWMLDDPRVNFAISQRGRGTTGLNHLGLQVDGPDELAGVRARFAAADAASVQDEAQANCCYAKSDKHWVTDPQGIAWEAFHTLDAIPLFDGSASGATATSACCAPAPAREAAATSACCAPTPAGEAVATSACCAPAPAGEAAATSACCAPTPAREAAPAKVAAGCCGG